MHITSPPDPPVPVTAPAADAPRGCLGTGRGAAVVADPGVCR